ncbi:MAG: hypothetical protein IKA13_03240 [Bacteroidales bacterium]|nr:hypothetical protein [Bacteroidales bacterium]
MRHYTPQKHAQGTSVLTTVRKRYRYETLHTTEARTRHIRSRNSQNGIPL